MQPCTRLAYTDTSFIPLTFKREMSDFNSPFYMFQSPVCSLANGSSELFKSFKMSGVSTKSQENKQVTRENLLQVVNM